MPDLLLSDLQGKTPQRLREIRKKYRRLCFDSDAASGLRDSVEFKQYHAIVRECDRLLKLSKEN